METHIFCSPQFILEVPSSAASAVLTNGSGGRCVSTEALLGFQSDLYELCSPSVRRRVHYFHSAQSAWRAQHTSGGGEHTMNPLLFTNTTTMASAAQTLPSPPQSLCFLSATGTTASLSEEQRASIAFSLQVVHSHDNKHGQIKDEVEQGEKKKEEGSACVLLTVSDSRVAAELHMLALQSHSLTLSHRCRLLLYFRAVARTQQPSLTDLRAKRERERERHNMDDMLWGKLQEGRGAARLESARAEGTATEAGGRLLTREERQMQRVRAFLRYCEETVEHCGVLTVDDEASPFLLSIGLFFDLRLSAGDLSTHVLRHPRRVIRAVGLMIARHVLPCEEVGAYFYASLNDGVRIACTDDRADGEETAAVSDIAQDLLLNDEVNEVWLPRYHQLFMDTRVRPMVEQMRAHHAERLAEREIRKEQQTANAASAAAADKEEEEDRRKNKKSEPAKGPSGHGTGVAALFRGGIRNLRDLATRVREEQRALRPQRMATLLSRRRTETAELGAVEVSGSDVDSAGDDDLDDDFLIDVEVEDGNGASGSGRQLVLGSKRSAVTATEAVVGGDAKRQRLEKEEAPLNTTKWVLTSGYRTVMALLARTEPFDRRNEHVLEW